MLMVIVITNTYHNPVRYVLSPFYRRGASGTERVCNQPKVTRLLGKPEFIFEQSTSGAHTQPLDTCLPEKGAQSPKGDSLGRSSPFVHVVTHRDGEFVTS